MEYAIPVFFLGLMVTALVGKGLLAAHEFARDELARQDAEKQAAKSSR